MGSGRRRSRSLGFTHEVAIQRESGSARATGRRTYEPIRILKRIDKSSPLLASVLTRNSTCETAVIEFFGNNEAGEPIVTYSITLENATLAAVRQRKGKMFTDIAGTVSPGPGFLEEVSLVFQRITTSHPPSGIEHSDDWADGAAQ